MTVMEDSDMRGTNVLGNFVSLLLGMVIGAAIALLFAPESGSELRFQIGEKATAARQQFRSEYERSRNWVEEEAAKPKKDQPSENAT